MLQPPLDFLLKLPKEQEIVEFEYVGNTFYYWGGKEVVATLE